MNDNKLKESDWSPPSALPGAAWPAVPSHRHAVLHSLLVQLEQTQWWDEAQLREQQFLQLRSLLTHAYRTVPFYRKRLDEAGVDPRRVAPETWAAVPLLTRAELQTAGAALRSTAVPAAHGPLTVKSTSGSTGMPVTVAGTALNGLFWTAITCREYLWHRRCLSGKVAAIRKWHNSSADYPHGLAASSWGDDVGVLGASGPAAFLAIATPVAQQLEWLRRQDPDYLLTYPSNLAELIRLGVQQGVVLPRLRGVTTIAEVVHSELRDACRQAWGAPITDLYSTQEAGYLALQCPEHEHYHVQGEVALVEVLDDGGRPCAAGEVGKVVVTSLHNFATPLIRYAIGDYAEVGPPCSCGRGLPVLLRILGRVRNMLTLPNGEKSWPRCGYHRFRQIAPIRQFQIVQPSRDALEVRLVADRPLTAGEEEEMREVLGGSLGKGFRIAFSYPREIARGRGGKYEEFVSEIAT